MILEMSSIPNSGIYGNPFQFNTSYIKFYIPTKGKRANDFISMEILITSKIQFVEEELKIKPV